MKKLLLALSLMFTLGLSAPSAKAYFYIDYPDYNWAEDYYLGSAGYHAFVFYNWQGVTDLDIFTMHGSPFSTPINVSIGGGPSAIGYWFDYLYTSGGYMYFDGYVTYNGSTFYYVGTYYL